MPYKAILAALGTAIVVTIIIAVALIATEDRIDLSDDPRGREACDALVQAQEYSGDAEIAIGSLLTAGEAASKARTQEIRDTATGLAEGAGIDEADAGGLADFATVDQDELQAVCESAGIEFPE